MYSTEILDLILKNTSHIKEKYYETISKDLHPLYLWGCGVIAEDVVRYCENFGINLSGCFVNVDNHPDFFCGFNVLSLSEVINKENEFSVIIGHAQYKDGMSFLSTISQISKSYCLPSFIYGIYNNLSLDQLEKKIDVIKEIYEELNDKLSKEIFLSYFKSILYEDATLIYPYYYKGISYFNNGIFKILSNESYLDIGACDGKTIEDFIHHVNRKLRTIIALEPEKINFGKLIKKYNNSKESYIILKQICAYNMDGIVRFCGKNQHGGIISDADNYVLYPSQRIDSLCEELGIYPTLMKINFPFCLCEVLEGARWLIKNHKPRIIIRIGFDLNIMLKTCKLINELNSDYDIYFRYTECVPQALTLFAI